MAGLSSAQMAKIDSALKRANTRIARLEDAFGSDSSIVKNQISTFEKGSLHKYVGKSKSGHWKLEKGKIMKDIRSGALNYDQANEILRNAAGVQISGEGEVKPSKFGGFQTRQEIYENTVDAITSGSYDFSKWEDENGFIQMNKKILAEIAEELNTIAESFQTEYEDSPLTEEEMKSDPMLSDLFNTDHGGTRSKRQLTYTELQNIAGRLAKVKSDLEEEKAKGSQNNDYLANKAGE